MADDNDDFFAELDAEIAVHVKRSQIRKDAAEAKKRANNRALAESERLAALQTWREYQAIIDAEIWRPISLVAFFTEQVCDGCGSIHRVFLQYMEQQRHRHRPHERRWVRVSVPEPHLPKEILIQTHKTHVCADCADEHGFVFEEASYFDMPSAISISSTYVQGDINATPEEDRPTASNGVATAGEHSV